MDKHQDCEDRCQLREHKGYDTRSRVGRCEWLQGEISRLVPKAESGADRAHICKLEAELNNGPFFAHR